MLRGLSRASESARCLGGRPQIPAQAGIHRVCSQQVCGSLKVSPWTPAFAGVCGAEARLNFGLAHRPCHPISRKPIARADNDDQRCQYQHEGPADPGFGEQAGDQAALFDLDFESLSERRLAFFTLSTARWRFRRERWSIKSVPSRWSISCWMQTAYMPSAISSTSLPL